MDDIPVCTFAICHLSEPCYKMIYGVELSMLEPDTNEKKNKNQKCNSITIFFKTYEDKILLTILLKEI